MPRYLITSELGPRRKMTPEGFLVCVDVPIARTGDYEYNANEGQSPGIQPGDDGKIISKREPAEVFAPAALASFEGKPVTIGHPTEDVTPANWKQYAVGTVSNVRRGSGDDADKVIADLIISDRSAIEAINQGLRELSCGYDVTLQQKERGVEVQTMIRGNHVALVDAGRAGPSCAIRDSKGGKRMDDKKEGFSWEQVKELVGMLGGLFKGGAPAVTDAEPVKGTEPAAPATDPAEGDKKADDELEALKQRIAELEAERDALKAELESDLETELVDSDEEVIVETGEGKADSAPLGFANRIEILAPGMRFDKPAKTDAKADARKVKLDAMRRALDRACDDDMKRDIIMSVAGKKVDSWYSEKDARVARVFKAASAALACVNDARIPVPVSHADSATSNTDYTKKVMDRYAEFAKGGKR